ncbi:MAG TPA: carboxylesterase family protein [Caulobacteraceae bacterium]|nr:carboxylesterase family protein [Caulobacteraceae bacterium]
MNPSPSRRDVLAGAAAAAVSGSAAAQDGGGLEVAVRQGRLHGAMEDGVRVFKGVPFARPPVGPLRFRPPQPAPPWGGVREAVQFSAPPLQGGGGLPGAAAPSEDCLYLNVWAPTTPGPHPVLVFCYGGGNNGGAGSQPVYSGARFARDGVVAVTINYRVGALGWVELGPHLPGYAGSGNNALRDIVASLAWVRDNIAAFGGDPRQVTLGGVLAGSKNVMVLLATPSAAGLFHRAVTMSTSAHTTHTPEEADKVARLFVDGHTGKAADLLTATSAEILAAQRKVLAAYDHNSAFRSIVDGRLMPRRIMDAFRAGASRTVPLLIGTTRDESASTLPRGAADKPFPINQMELNSLDLSQTMDLDLRYQRAFPAMSALDRRRRLVHAEEYWISCIRVGEARARLGAATYMYRSDRVLKTGLYAGYAPSGSDIPLAFDTLDKGEVVGTGATVTAEDQALATTAHAAWVNFVRSGTPSAPGLPAWPRYEPGRRQTMILGYRPAVESDPLRAERVLWDDYYG